MCEKLKICPNCHEICKVNWKFCTNCGTSVINQEELIVKYAFVNEEKTILEPVTNSLAKLLQSSGAYIRIFNGHFIVRIFEFNLRNNTVFIPIDVYLQTEISGKYVRADKTFAVSPPTK